MVRDREGSGKDRARLAVFLLTIAEEQRVGRRIAVPQLTGLPHIAARDSRTVVHMAAILDDEVVGYHATPDDDRRLLAAHQGTVGKAGRAIHDRARSDIDIPQEPRIRHMRADSNHAAIGSLAPGIVGGEPLQAGDELWTVAVQRFQIRFVGR